MKQVVGCLLLCVSFIATGQTTVVVKPLSELLAASIQSAPAQVINDDHALVSARLSADVEKVWVQVGDSVEKGQPLLQLVCRDYQLAKQQSQSVLKSLQAKTRLARLQLSRAEKLLKQKSASLELRDQRRAELISLLAQEDGAKVGLSTAELSIERCVPKAPFSGVITDRKVSEGDLVSSGSPLFKVLGATSNEVSADLTMEQITGLEMLDSIHYLSGGEQYPLELRAVVPFIDTRVRTQEVRFIFKGKAALAGSSGRVQWQESKGRLPIQYVVSRDGQLGLMRIVDGKAEFVALSHAVEGQAPQVDLPMGQKIIVEGQHGIEAGQDVIVAE